MYLALVVLQMNGTAAEPRYVQVFLYCIAVSCSEDHRVCSHVSLLPTISPTADGTVPKDKAVNIFTRIWCLSKIISSHFSPPSS